MDDDEIEEMFGIIDGDGGGTISGQEFYEGLAECASPCLPISRAPLLLLLLPALGDQTRLWLSHSPLRAARLTPAAVLPCSPRPSMDGLMITFGDGIMAAC